MNAEWLRKYPLQSSTDANSSSKGQDCPSRMTKFISAIPAYHSSSSMSVGEW
eukprot:CAMPEP_0201932808 /NCGR_PEP_ID=MMETSP0903-20130614/30244_1 /ASSEMBLY_ACC=CAM_ASM_000552 /TAXON_ID=420261 /ORGANISM="Thalassiosira antarctica, Strain CCMP982" /LENGTH=51 /DNA_ID=CAMNT_0048472545 /DNA_START=388 /DNA_END=543 /DNA_ORIENTATION=+